MQIATEEQIRERRLVEIRAQRQAEYGAAIGQARRYTRLALEALKADPANLGTALRNLSLASKRTHRAEIQRDAFARAEAATDPDVLIADAIAAETAAANPSPGSPS